MYAGIAFVLGSKWLKDRTIYSFIQVALGMMLSHFVVTFAVIFHTHNLYLPMSLHITAFLSGFFIGTGILMVYSTLKESIMEGPADAVMMEEFGHKFFFLDPDIEKRRRFNIYSLRYDLAICYGLHGIGGGLLFSQIIKSTPSGSLSIVLLPILIYKLIEGLSIAAPIAHSPLKLSSVIMLGAIAGVPFVSGVSLGELHISPFFSMFLFSLSAGALFYCLIMLTEMVYMTQRSDVKPFFTIFNITLFFCLFYLLHQFLH